MKNSSSGSVFVHKLVGGSWVFDVELTEGAGEEFGTSLSQKANRIAVRTELSKFLNRRSGINKGVFLLVSFSISLSTRQMP